MPKETERTAEEIRHRTEPRYFELPYVCQHCKHIISVGNQFFDPTGWTCSVFPEQVPQGALSGRTPHTVPFASQVGTDVYDPIIYVEADTDRRWKYNPDGTWSYVDADSASSVPIPWRDLDVYDPDGGCRATLGQMVDRGYVALHAIVLADSGSIREWVNHLVAGPAEAPDWDTPKIPVDWTGFREALANLPD